MESNEANVGEAEMLSRVSSLMRDHLPERVSPSPSEDWNRREGSIRNGGSHADLKELDALNKEVASAEAKGDSAKRGLQVDDIEEQSTVVEPFIIGVAGASASGKTTVCEKIIQGLGDHRCVLVSLDWFCNGIPDNIDSSAYNFDHPDAFDFNYLYQVLKWMQKGQPVDVPTYDFKTHKRSASVLLNAAEVIIVEGILTFYPRFIRKMMHMKIFVDEDADVCLCRRIRRDTEFRGRTLSQVLNQYEKFVKPGYDEFIFPTKRHADIIVPRGGGNHVAINLIVQHIALKLQQEGDFRKLYPQLHRLEDNSQIRGLHTIFRNTEASREDFVFYADRLIRLVVERGLGLLPFSREIVTTPTGEPYFGVAFVQGIIGVSIIRSGESMETSLRAVCKTARIGKMLIANDGPKNDCSNRRIAYCSLPQEIHRLHVLLLDPVLDTGGTVACAIEELLSRGVPMDNITVLNLISSPDGLSLICGKYPRIKVVTSSVDRGVNKDGYVVPGVGDFANRYFGT